MSAVTVVPGTLPDGCEHAGPRDCARGLARNPSRSGHLHPGGASSLSSKNTSSSRSMLMWWRSDVNLSFFLCLALCRMRSSACDTVPRLCVRPVLCWLAFPLVSALEALDLVEFARNCLRNHVIHCQAGRCQRYIDT